MTTIAFLGTFLPPLAYLVALVLVMRGVDKRVDVLKRRLSDLETKAWLAAKEPIALPIAPPLVRATFKLPELPLLPAADGYRTSCAPDVNRLAPLCGTFVVSMSDIDHKRVLFSMPGCEGISLTHWGFGKLSASERSVIASALDQGKLKVTVELVP